MSVPAAVPASPLQRLRLVSLGLPVHQDLTADWADSMLARAPEFESDHPTEQQVALAKALGVTVEPGDCRGPLGGRVYEVYLALTWVFSVWRQATGEKAAVWTGLSLPRPQALAVARELVGRGLLDGLRVAPTAGEDSDLFCAIDGEILLTNAYRVTLRALGLRARSSSGGWSLRKLFS